MSDNDMLYMDVTTTCPDCVLQGKTIEGCAFCDGRGRAYLHDMYKRENDALREKVEAWGWFEECFEVMQWLVLMGPNRADACEEAVISTLHAQKSAVNVDRE